MDAKDPSFASQDCGWMKSTIWTVVIAFSVTFLASRTLEVDYYLPIQSNIFGQFARVLSRELEHPE